MHYDPKCFKAKHKCSQVCITPTCTVANPFICGSCENQHSSVSCEVILYKKLIGKFRKINGTYTNELLRFE